MSWITRIYNWVTDKNNGVPITASRMDAEFDNIISGMNTLHSSLGTVEWVEDTHTASVQSTTTFWIIGVDLTATYHVGRRFKIVDGVSTIYGTVTATSYTGGNTQITVAATANLSGITTLYYGSLSFQNPSYLDPRSAVAAAVSFDQAYTATAAAKIHLSDLQFDTLGEFEPQTTYRFTTKYPGYYLITLNVDFVQTSSAARDIKVMIYKNGTQYTRAELDDGLTVDAGARWDTTATLFLNLVKGDYIEAYFSSANDGDIKLTSTGGGAGTRLQIMRIV